MHLLYEKVYRQKQEKFKLDGNLQEFNSFISRAQQYQFDIVSNAKKQTEFDKWLRTQIGA